jgi:hypothetical protein
VSAAGDAREGALERLRELLRAQGGLIASLVSSAPATAPAATPATVDGAPTPALAEGARSPAVPADGAPTPAALAARGPRAQGRRAEYELLIEAIYEGYLLHYGTPRVVQVGEQDLRLLAGDQLYAIGLARLVELGDTHAVAELADTITLAALAQGAGERELADAVWSAGARAVGWGPSEAHARAKDLLCAGAPEAIEAMRTSA